MKLQELYELYLRHPKVSIDSRKVEPGCLFFAIKGERFDGNQFAAAALAAGAAYAVVDDPAGAQGGRCIVVEDSLQTLQELARHHRRQFFIPVIGITGSNGKTTTKELAAAVLGSHYRLHFTQGNFNNHIGVPLTLLAMPPDVEVAVIEMGANHQGEIDFLSRIAEPSHGLITNIGKAHLEGFGGIEGVKKGKSELYRFLAETGGMAFVNRDERFLEGLAAPVQKKVFYRRSAKPSLQERDIEIRLLADRPFVRVAFIDPAGKEYEANSQLIGIYNFNNIMTAIALGKYFKVPCAKIARAIEAYVPANMRSQLLERDGNTIVLDAYNANPNSMREAILTFAAMDARRRIAILGDMLELGEDSRQEHERIAELAAQQGFDDAVFVGPEFEATARTGGFRHFANVGELKRWFDAQGFRGCHILIKGSRGIRLEEVLGGAVD
ncbi:MAG: UDP-N-acetylmuramoyl-tripeptide--D-alanyl-D-alanine ligase [Lewinellaceae bacterium]|nr:UDP-N-acetylmuramoyl-tripeptide--D-alanyl-D-alanine ligase [Lewinellaceae bacterium]